jgi:hypothetical protein
MHQARKYPARDPCVKTVINLGILFILFQIGCGTLAWKFGIQYSLAMVTAGGIVKIGISAIAAACRMHELFEELTETSH